MSFKQRLKSSYTMTRFEFSWKMIPESRSRDITVTIKSQLVHHVTACNFTITIALFIIVIDRYKVNHVCNGHTLHWIQDHVQNNQMLVIMVFFIAPFTSSLVRIRALIYTTDNPAFC